MKDIFKIYVIHHSHTDIGYTDMQSVIINNHFDYIRQAIKIIEKDKSFVWTLENFWQVENFISKASKEEYNKFIECIKSGNIVVTANYLNMTDLIDYDIYNNKIKEFSNFIKSIEVDSKSALTCDVNGFKKDYMRALLRNDITNLMTSVHPHHGVAPTNNVNNPFYIEVDQNRLLVWNNQHYLYGNDLGIVPATLFSYTIKDEFDKPLGSYDLDEELSISVIRIKRFIKSLRENESYKFNFVPILVNGQRIDNAAPNKLIIERMNLLNEKLQEESIHLEFASLDNIFDQVKKNDEIPIYSGEFPDFWIDGIISTPKETKLFLNTQREYLYFMKLDSISKYEADLNRIEQLLLLFSEHTWGHSDSIKNPYNDYVYNIQVIKQNYVYEAHRLLTEIKEDYKYKVLESKYNSADKDTLFEVINPLNESISGIVTLKTDHFERIRFNEGIDVVDQDGNSQLLDVDFSNNISEVKVYVELNRKSTKVLKIVPGLIKEIKRDLLSGDIFENQWISIDFNKMSFYDKDNEVYLTDGSHFGIIHQISKVENEPILTREKLGLNKATKEVTNYNGTLERVSIVMESMVSTEVEVKYKMQTMDELIVVYKIYKNIKQIDIEVKFLKKATYDIENVYFRFPFSYEEIKLVNKFDEVIPWVDQISGSLIDYYYTNSGVKFENEKYKVHLITLDNPLVTIGNLSNHEVKVKERGMDLNKRQVSSWIMNNIWETNFNLDLGGFFNFRYLILIEERKQAKVYNSAINNIIITRK